MINQLSPLNGDHNRDRDPDIKALKRMRVYIRTDCFDGAFQRSCLGSPCLLGPPRASQRLPVPIGGAATSREKERNCRTTRETT